MLDTVNILFRVVLGIMVFLGYLSYKKTNFFFKLIFYQALYTGCTTIVAIIHRNYVLGQNRIVNNHWLGNINLFIELSILFYAFWVFFNKPWEKKIVLIAYLLFVLSFVTSWWQQGFWVKLNYADLTSCFFMTPILVYAYYLIAQDKDISIWKSPEKIAIMGMLVYFAGSVPFIAMWDYLMTNSPKVLAYLYISINYTIAYIRYIFVGIAFWLIYKNAKKQIVSS